MPLARIDLAEGRTADYRKTIGEVVYDAQVGVLKAPKNDRFQVITEHPVQNFIFDPSHLDIQKSKDCVFIQDRRPAPTRIARHFLVYSSIRVKSRSVLRSCVPARTKS
ncbi:MAG: tautomerase family protein [Candidatus Korobacteraceae bacterium]